MLTEIVLYIARLSFLILLLVNLVYLLMPAQSVSKDRLMEYRLEHSVMAITGSVALLVLQFV